MSNDNKPAAAPGTDHAEMVKSNLRSIKRLATVFPISHVSAANIMDEANHALALIDANSKGGIHPDDAAVDAFAAEMRLKLADARAKGRGGWQIDEPGMQQHLSDLLRDHVEKGDPRDVANFCMFLHQRGEGISPKGDSDAASITEPHQECYSDDGGDSWYEHPADAAFVQDLKAGDTYILTVSHYSVERTYRVTKAPDETSDDYEVEPVQATSAEVGA